MVRAWRNQVEEPLKAGGSDARLQGLFNIGRDNGGVRILIVEDDELLARSLARGLGAEGYAVDLAADGVDGLYRAQEYDYDAMILDILLPGMNGYLVCAKLRAGGADLPVLMLTAKDGAWDEAEGLDTGADDYLIKPFQYPVLLARLRALIRRGPTRLPPVLTHGPLSMDPGRHRCALSGEPLDLTPREFALLRYLMTHPSVTLSKQDLLEHVWGENDAADHNVVQVYVSALRRKIDPPDGASLVETVRGIGYRLADAD
jgi:DNA-binding response OmpR family regulator